MEFWGVEVKGGTPLKVSPEEGFIIHMSQAAIGESKSKAESVPLYVTVDEKKLVLGTLSQQNAPQIQFDLVFASEFELSHNWKNGSIFFCGYKTEAPGAEDDAFLSGSDEEVSEEEEEELPTAAPVAAANGKPKKVAEPAPAKSVKITEPIKDEDESEDDSEDDSDDDEDDSDDSDEDEETPVKAESSKAAGKKRAPESATKTPQQKKAKTATPQKTDSKKSAHTATPHPSKKVAKTAAPSPSSGSQVSCGSCSKKFNSEKALESHSKAKHSAAK